MISKEAAEKKVKRFYKTWMKTRQQGMKDFAEICREAHEAGITDEGISALIDGGYSRSRIQQFRAGKISRKDTHG